MEVTFEKLAELVQALTDAQGFLNHFYSRESHGIEEDDLNEERKKLLAWWRQELKMGAYPHSNNPTGEPGDPGDLTPCQPGLPAWPNELEEPGPRGLPGERGQIGDLQPMGDQGHSSRLRSSAICTMKMKYKIILELSVEESSLIQRVLSNWFNSEVLKNGLTREQQKLIGELASQIPCQENVFKK